MSYLHGKLKWKEKQQPLYIFYRTTDNRRTEEWSVFQLNSRILFSFHTHTHTQMLQASLNALRSSHSRGTVYRWSSFLRAMTHNIDNSVWGGGDALRSPPALPHRPVVAPPGASRGATQTTIVLGKEKKITSHATKQFYALSLFDCGSLLYNKTLSDKIRLDVIRPGYRNPKMLTCCLFPT